MVLGGVVVASGLDTLGRYCTDTMHDRTLVISLEVDHITFSYRFPCIWHYRQQIAVAQCAIHTGTGIDDLDGGSGFKVQGSRFVKHFPISTQNVPVKLIRSIYAGTDRASASAAAICSA